MNEYAGHITGALRVGSLPLARTQIVPHAVTKILEEFASARVSIIDGSYHEQLDALRHGQIDLIIGALRHPPPSSDIQQQSLFSDSLHIVVRPGHPIASDHSTSVLELQELDWVAPGINAPSPRGFYQFF